MYDLLYVKKCSAIYIILYQYNDKLCTFYTRDESGATHSAYLMVKINHKPIEEADYDVNVHQLKAVIKKFEQEKIESDKKIEELTARIRELENNFIIDNYTN